MQLLFVLWIGLSAALAAEREPITEEGAAITRQMHGIKDLRNEADADYFAFREEGTFLISKADFSSQADAAAFCASKLGFRLTEGLMPGVLTYMGLPFVSLYERMAVDPLVFGSEDNPKNGIAFWIHFDLSVIPANHKFSPEDLEKIAMIKANDFFMVMTNGDGGRGDGIYQVSLTNERLRALGAKLYAGPAICIDEQIYLNMESKEKRR